MWSALSLLIPLLAIPTPTLALPDASTSDLSDHLPIPKRPLVWGDVNFIHTTDIHGWLLGHQHSTWPEPHYSGNLGDLSSFLTHLRQLAHSRQTDFLLVDTGDHHDGTGIVSAPPLERGGKNGSHPSGGEIVDTFLSELGYDVLAIGNHEMYKYGDALEVASATETGRTGHYLKLSTFDDIADVKNGDGRKWTRGKGRWTKNGVERYLTTNANITMPNGVNRPIGGRVAKFKTAMGRKVTAFGIIYNFHASSKNLTAQNPLDLVKEPWFLEAISEKPDFFVLTGHMSVNDPDSQWPTILSTIRAKHGLEMPVFIFGGHTHIRNCERLDGWSMTLGSGRYMETVGWMSANLTEEVKGEGLSMSRRYLDNNRQTYKFHSAPDGKRFDTPKGEELASSLLDIHSSLNLSTVIGHAPQDYFLARYPVSDERSLLRKLMDDVLPSLIVEEGVEGPGGDKKSGEGARIYLANSGCQRFDIFEGPFTIDDQYAISPFTSNFVYITLPARIVRPLRAKMNELGASQLWPNDWRSGRQLQWEEEREVGRRYGERMREARGEYERGLRLGEGMQKTFGLEGAEKGEEVEKRYGYVTKDKCGPGGDDIEHVPVPHAGVPDYVSTTFPDDIDDDEEVYVIAMDFFLNDVVNAVHILDPSYSNLTEADFKPFGANKLSINEIWGKYAREYWN